jgi:hypothetical protein
MGAESTRNMYSNLAVNNKYGCLKLHHVVYLITLMHVGGQNSKFLNITVCGTYSNHWDRDGKERHVIYGRRRTEPTRAASLLQGRLFDYRTGDSLCCSLYVKQSAVLSVSLKHTNIQSAIQFWVKVKMNSHERQNSVTCWKRGDGGTTSVFNSKCQQGQIFLSLLIWTEFHLFGV